MITAEKKQIILVPPHPLSMMITDDDDDDVDHRVHEVLRKEHAHDGEEDYEDVITIRLKKHSHKIRKPKVIAPLNTDINFDKLLPRFKPRTRYGAAAAAKHAHDHPADEPPPKGIHYHEHVHENFSWHAIEQRHDDVAQQKLKRNIHPVFNQHNCGSCWAVSFANTMSDCVMIGAKLDYNPMISISQCMACYPQSKCQGGNPAALAKAVESGGVSDISCMDYSWCENSESCNSTDASGHFRAEDHSTKVPSQCQCFFGGMKRLYYIDKGTDHIAISDALPIETFRQTVKSHILDHGPVVGGYVVLRDFLSGDFVEHNGGVYLDRATYSRSGRITFSDRTSSLKRQMGLHAVSIVGWGVANNILYDTDKIGPVPFWWCRNSWGTDWGDEGYFKCAMYPFNKTAQFDKLIRTRDGGMIGGMIMIRCSRGPVKREFNSIPAHVMAERAERFLSKRAQRGGASRR